MSAFNLGAGDNQNINMAFRKASANDEDFDDLFDRRESMDDGTAKRPAQQIKLSQVMEGSLYIELQKEC